MRINFNDDHTKIGIEGWYEIIDNKLIIYIEPTSNLEDWISNFTAIPFPIEPFQKGSVWCHLGYRSYAKWAEGYFTAKIEDSEEEIKEVIIFGYSMGGGIAQIIAKMIEEKINIKVINIDGPRTLSKCPEYVKTFYNKGSLVHSIPPWFQISKDKTCLNEKWRPVWISHADYNIEDIINENIK